MATISEAWAMAVGHHQSGRLQAAEQIYQQILAVEPNHADAWNLLGVINCQFGNHQVALDYIGRAIALEASAPAFHSNLGNVYQTLGKPEEAVACYRRALQLSPDHAEAHNNLGNALQAQGKRDEAAACYRRALELIPHFVDAHNNLGTVLHEKGRRDEAVACFRRALELRPDNAEAHYHLGTVLRELGEQHEAVACYRRALELKPDFMLAISALVHQLQNLCQWEDLKNLSQRVIDVIDDDAKIAVTAPVSPFSFLLLPTRTTARQQLRCARQWVKGQLDLPAELGRGMTHARLAHRKSKLTIGYLSADFHSHATAMLTAELFEKHDRDRFAIFGYSYGPDDGSPMRRRLVRAFDQFVDLKEASFLEAAQRIVTDEIDILVDLKGYTMDARTQIMALRPAPVQVNYLGYPGTMGASFVDYILVDDFIVPPDQQPFFTEKLVHLPGCYQVNDSQREISQHTPSRAECGLPDEGFVYCCFNNSYKITSEVFGVWMKLLKAAPGSVLWLLEGSRFVPANLRREAEAQGVAAQRLVFAPRVDVAEHLARHRLADLFLDTFPVNAHTTASEALWAGCPVLTIAGETFVSRVAGSLLCTLGLTELVANNLDEYETLALRLARDSKKLTELRAQLQTNRTISSLFDSGRFAKSLERAYLTMWDTYTSGEQPRTFRIGKM